jgi:GT2 family glycosyltransferase
VICVKDAEKYIEDCINSLLAQTFKDFEVVIIEDGSTDRTRNIIKKLGDKRIRYFENKENLGIAKSRNIGLRLSEGEYIFFTDSDCIVTKNWIEEGLKFLENPNCVGVEGKIFYVSEEYKPTFSDHVCENKYGGQFMTGNIAYKRSIIKKVGGFDEKYTYNEDRDLALRIMKLGKICFNPNMIVYVQQQTVTPQDLMASAHHIKNRVYLFKKFGERKSTLWRIVYPWNLAMMLFPPVLFLSPLFYSFRKLDDFRLLPFRYIHAIYERVRLWKECARERVFLI